MSAAWVAGSADDSDLSNNQVIDPSPLSGLANLKNMSLPNNQIRDLFNFGNLPALGRLICR